MMLSHLSGSLARLPYTLLSPSGEGAKLSIFIFHRVLPEPDPLMPWEPDRRQFDSIIAFLSRAYHVLPLGEAVRRLTECSLPAASAVVTFDDGYADNFTVAKDSLVKHGIPATFFIATAFLDGGRMWNDDVIEAIRLWPAGTLDLSDLELGTYQIDDTASRVKTYGKILGLLKYRPHQARAETARRIAREAGLSDNSTLMMTTHQLINLCATGMEIGAHTDSHPILNSLSDDEAEAEIQNGRTKLESILQQNVSVFAYPNGVPGKDYSARHVDMVRKAGFVAAVSTQAGLARCGADAWQLPRFTPWDRRIGRFALRCMTHLWQH